MRRVPYILLGPPGPCKHILDMTIYNIYNILHIVYNIHMMEYDTDDNMYIQRLGEREGRVRRVRYILLGPPGTGIHFAYIPIYNILYILYIVYNIL